MFDYVRGSRFVCISDIVLGETDVLLRIVIV